MSFFITSILPFIRHPLTTYYLYKRRCFLVTYKMMDVTDSTTVCHPYRERLTQKIRVIVLTTFIQPFPLDSLSSSSNEEKNFQLFHSFQIKVSYLLYTKSDTTLQCVTRPQGVNITACGLYSLRRNTTPKTSECVCTYRN